LTKLAVRFDECPGLDLTRATLAACLKYPWFREPSTRDRSKKWGAYKSEAEDFEFAREMFHHSAKTAEAALMDWADDIAYSVHDLEDFHRCGALPWHRILGGDHAEQLVSRADKNWHGKPPDATGRLREALRSLEISWPRSNS
jgi:dGTPase